MYPGLFVARLIVKIIETAAIYTTILAVKRGFNIVDDEIDNYKKYRQKAERDGIKFYHIYSCNNCGWYGKKEEAIKDFSHCPKCGCLEGLSYSRVSQRFYNLWTSSSRGEKDREDEKDKKKNKVQ